MAPADDDDEVTVDSTGESDVLLFNTVLFV